MNKVTPCSFPGKEGKECLEMTTTRQTERSPDIGDYQVAVKTPSPGHLGVGFFLSAFFFFRFFNLPVTDREVIVRSGYDKRCPSRVEKVKRRILAIV